MKRQPTSSPKGSPPHYAVKERVQAKALELSQIFTKHNTVGKYIGFNGTIYG